MVLASIRAAVAASFLACAILIAVPASAGSLTREDFTFPEDGQLDIVVFRPDVRVGSMKVGGMDEPNAEWTEQARANIQKALEDRAQTLDAKVRFIDELEGEDAKLLSDYRSLFEAVSGSMFTHVTVGDHLATKQVVKQVESGGRLRERKINTLDWTLGPGATELKAVTGADYAMFVFTHDAYGTAGRKVAQFLAAGLLGAYVPAGIHIGYAGLVDLETGNIVWFNTDLQMGGDPREADGAQKRVEQLMRGFPSRDDGAQD